MRRPDLALLLAFALSLVGAFSHTDEKPSGRLTSESRSLLARGQESLAAGNTAEARRSFERAMDLSPKAPEVFLAMAAIHELSGEVEPARKSFTKALKLAPTDVRVNLAYGAWLCKHGEVDAAMQAFGIGLADIRMRATGVPSFYAGSCAFHAGRTADAETHLREAVKALPRQPAVLMMLARIALQRGNLLDARAFMQRRDALGSDPEVLRLGIRIEQAAGDARAAAMYEKRLKEEFPNHPAPTGEGAGRP